MLPRKNCAAKFRKFVVWLRIIRRASRVSRTTKIRAFWREIANSIAAPAGLWDAVPRTETARDPQPPVLRALQHSPGDLQSHSPVVRANWGSGRKADTTNLSITLPIPFDIGRLPTYN